MGRAVASMRQCLLKQSRLAEPVAEPMLDCAIRHAYAVRVRRSITTGGNEINAGIQVAEQLDSGRVCRPQDDLIAFFFDFDIFWLDCFYGVNLCPLPEHVLNLFCR